MCYVLGFRNINMTMTICNKTPKPDVLIKYVKLAEQLASQNPTGKIPSIKWLRNNDYTGLYQYMRTHPKPFKHLEQEDSKPRSCDEKIKRRQVALAERLSSRTGYLRSSRSLREDGYNKLDTYMRRHPEFFEHIPQLQDMSTPEEHIESAERLARENGGTLPGPWTIIEETGWALYQYMRRNPSLFSHIPRE